MKKLRGPVAKGKHYLKALAAKVESATGSPLLFDLAWRLRGWRVLVAGMEGTGSTFVFQLVTGMGIAAGKVHHYAPGSLPKLVTYRDPRDVICSYAHRQLRETLEAEGLEAGLIASHRRLFQEHKRHQDLLRYRDDPHALLIRYEEYFGGREAALVDLLAERLRIAVDDRPKQRLLAAYSLEKNKQRADQLAQFSQVGQDSYIHGHHISSGGRSGVWRELFTRPVSELVKEDLGDLLIEFGYEQGADW